MQGGPTMIRKLARRARRLLRGRRNRFEKVDLTGWKIAPGFEPELLKSMSVSHPRLDAPGIRELATSRHHPEELVVGVVMDGEPRAYPLSVLNGHHVINDQIGDYPVVLSFCIKCFSPAVFHPVVDGRTLSFQAFGVYKGTFVMHDDQTGTIWTPMTGEALAGPLAGSRLEPIATEMIPTSRWLERYPTTTTIDRDHLLRSSPPAPGQAILDRQWLETVSHRDHRVPPRTLVLGVVIDGEATAYAVNGLAAPILHQDELADVPVVVLGMRGALPVVYDRRIPTGVVELRLQEGELVDAGGSTWDRNGLAIEGPLTGTQLEMISSRISEWYAWAANYPNTEVVEVAAPE